MGSDMGSSRWFVFLAVSVLANPAAHALDLTATERAWLEAALPVLQFARTEGLPLDIIVQPQPTPGETPLGMAFVGGRCKLVVSMRGNAEAQATLDRIEPGLRNVVVEAIAAHELGHCWRHIKQRWGMLPAGLLDATAWHAVSTAHADVLRDMWRTRREEGFADLVGLAWTQLNHPARYAEVHAWHVRLRANLDLETACRCLSRCRPCGWQASCRLQCQACRRCAVQSWRRPWSTGPTPRTARCICRTEAWGQRMDAGPRKDLIDPGRAKSINAFVCPGSRAAGRRAARELGHCSQARRRRPTRHAQHRPSDVAAVAAGRFAVWLARGAALGGLVGVERRQCQSASAPMRECAGAPVRRCTRRTSIACGVSAKAWR